MEKFGDAHLGLARDLVELIREAVTKTRALARGLSPVYLDEAALYTAIQGLAKQVEMIFGVSFRLDVRRVVNVKDNASAVHIYRIIQEAVNNAVRHGKARHISIALKPRKTGLTLTIADDGIGLPAEIDLKKGLGLSIMRHRARMIGAELTIQNNSKGGVSVICQLAREL
jgi:signal transduction histidine kinase